MHNIKSITVELDDGRNFKTECISAHALLGCGICGLCNMNGIGCSELCSKIGSDTIFKEIKRQ